MKKLYKLIFGITLATFTLGAEAATLSVSPTSRTVNVGDTFTVDIVLDTQGVGIDGVDVFYLNQNPSLLEVVDNDSGTAGIQIDETSTVGSTVYNSTNNTIGQIALSQVASGGTTYNGSGVLGTITFRALAAGTASLNFDFTLGNTSDSNVASNGSDVLSAVTNGTITINTVSGGGSPPPPPPPSPSPSPSSGGGGGGGSSSGGSSGGGGGSSSGGGGTSTVCTPGSVVSSLARNLALGARGSDVTVLQNFLVSRGHLTADNATGYYGYATEAAIKALQRVLGIVSSGDPNSTGYGAVGPTTRARINSLMTTSSTTCTPTVGSAGAGSNAVAVLLARNLALGARGSDVTVLQNFLVSRGHLTADNATGYYGYATEAAIKALQKVLGIVSSGDPNSTGYGAVGPTTRARINALLGASSSSSGAGASVQTSASVQAQIQALQKQAAELLLKLQQSQ